MVLGDMLNLTWRFIQPSNGSMWSLRSYLNDMYSGKSDLVGGGWIGKIWYEMDEFSAPSYNYDGYRIISVEPLKGLRWNAFIKPFDIPTWIMLLSTIPICSITLYFLRKFSKHPDKKATIGEAAWDTSIILFWDSIRSPDPPVSIICHFSAYLFMSLTLVTAFMGVYTSLILNPVYDYPPIDTLAQFWDSDMKWITYSSNHDAHFKWFFDHVPNIEERHVTFAVEESDKAVHSLEQLTDNPEKYILFATSGIMNYYENEYGIASKKGRNLHHSKQSFDLNYGTIYFNRHAFFKEGFNRKILTLHAMDIIRKNVENYNLIVDVQIALDNAKEPGKRILLQFVHFSGGYLILFISSLPLQSSVR